MRPSPCAPGSMRVHPLLAAISSNKWNTPSDRCRPATSIRYVRRYKTERRETKLLKAIGNEDIHAQMTRNQDRFRVRAETHQGPARNYLGLHSLSRDCVWTREMPPVFASATVRRHRYCC
jgi:hypothetical protein